MEKFQQQIVLAAVGAIATGVVIYWFINRGGEVVKDVANELNPASPDNFVYDNVINGLGSVLSGDDNYDFGAHLYDIKNDPKWSLFGGTNGKLNPRSPNNIPYKATNYVGSKLTGKPNFDLGVWFYDLTHSDKATGPNMVKPTGNQKPVSVVDKINPASSKNFIYSGVNKLGSVISGDDDFDLGGWIFKLTN